MQPCKQQCCHMKSLNKTESLIFILLGYHCFQGNEVWPRKFDISPVFNLVSVFIALKGHSFQNLIVHFTCLCVPAVDVVLNKRPIKMLGVTVEVEAYVPYLEHDDILKSINLSGLPHELVKDIAEVTLNDLKGNAAFNITKILKRYVVSVLGHTDRLHRSQRLIRMGTFFATHPAILDRLIGSKMDETLW